MREQPLRHLLAPAELGHEVRVEPGLVDAQVRVGEQTVAVEPLDVVALEGRAVAPDLDVVLEHRPDQQGPGDRAAERRGVEVRAPGGADVERAAGQRGQALLDQRRTAVDQACDLRAVRRRTAGHRGDVGLVVLTDVGGVRAGHGALVTHPRDGDRRVEAAREGDTDALAGGQGGENLGHSKSMHCFALSCNADRVRRATGRRPECPPDPPRGSYPQLSSPMVVKTPSPSRGTAPLGYGAQQAAAPSRPSRDSTV